jgi:hypothetical protein
VIKFKGLERPNELLSLHSHNIKGKSIWIKIIPELNLVKDSISQKNEWTGGLCKTANSLE